MAEKDLAALRAELQGYRRREEGYVFVSYAHQDAGQVFPLAASWLRQGWNVYIDTDFERHTSDRNWVELMTEALTDPRCRMAVCFVSPHYGYSYAALLEALTMRLERERRRETGVSLAVDYIRLAPLETGDMPDGLAEVYEAKFQEMKSRMTRFSSGLKEEGGLALLLEGLDHVYGRPQEGEARLEALNRAFFNGGREDFYSCLALLMEKSLAPFDKNVHVPQEKPELQLERFRQAGVACAPPLEALDPDALFQRAGKGDSEAMGLLGLAYLTGEGLPKDLNKAVTWLDQAADRENARAQYLLGHLFFQEKGIRNSFETGVWYLERAAEAGFVPAPAELALRFWEARHSLTYPQEQQRFQNVDRLEAVKPEDPNYAAVCACLARYFHKGADGKYSDRGLEYLEKAAELGFVPAAYALGDYYAGRMRGPGKAKNGPLALRWFHRAAEAGPEAWAGTGSDETVLCRQGLIQRTKTCRGLSRTRCRQARYQLAACYGHQEPKWDFLEKDPEKEAWWTHQAEALED